MNPETAEHYINQSRAERVEIASKIAMLTKLWDGKLENEIRIQVELLMTPEESVEPAQQTTGCTSQPGQVCAPEPL